MSRPTLLALPLIACIGACASGPATPEPTVQAQGYQYMSDAKKEAADDDVICKRQQVVGTHFKQEVCATKAEWERAHEYSQEMMRRGQKGASLPRE